MMKPGWLMTFTGRAVYPLEFTPADVDITDIAHALASQCRYAGHTNRFYSVAEHSVIVSKYVPIEYAREGLLHDASEAYIQDILMGLKRTEVMAAYRDLEKVIEAAVFERFDIRSTPESAAAVKAIDTRIVLDETRDLFDNYAPFWDAREGLSPLGCQIRGYAPDDAKYAFFGRFYRLFPSEAP